MSQHTHHFVENYQGLLGFGLDRETDEKTIICYLQKFSDDALMKQIVKRMSDEDLNEIFDMTTRMMKKHLSESEYHRLFLKDTHP